MKGHSRSTPQPDKGVDVEAPQTSMVLGWWFQSRRSPNRVDSESCANAECPETEQNAPPPSCALELVIVSGGVQEAEVLNGTYEQIGSYCDRPHFSKDGLPYDEPRNGYRENMQIWWHDGEWRIGNTGDHWFVLPENSKVLPAETWHPKAAKARGVQAPIYIKKLPVLPRTGSFGRNESFRGTESFDDTLDQQSNDDGLQSTSAPEKRPLAKFLSVRGVLLTSVLPFLDALSRCYCFACVPLQFLDRGWPLSELSALFFCANLGCSLTSALILRWGDQACVQLLVLSTIASAGMVWKPDTKTAVLVGILVHRCCCKGSQAYRGLIQLHYGDSPETLASGLRIFNFSDVLGYSFASLVGGVLYEFGSFQACAWFQFIATLTQALLSYAVCRGTGVTVPRPPLDTDHAATAPESATPVTTMEVTPRRCSVVSASFAIVSVGMSAFLYTCEWNTFALYFREVYGWGSAWTGFAQMIGDLFAGMCLVLVSVFKLRAPPMFENKVMQVALVYGSYAVFYYMLASSTFAVSVAGQVLMGISYVLSVEVSSFMMVVYARGDQTFYRRLIFAHEIAFSGGIALSAVAVVVYDIDKTLPFYGCAWISIFWGFFYVMYLCQRFARGGGGCVSICGKNFEENEEALFQKKISQIQITPPV